VRSASRPEDARSSAAACRISQISMQEQCSPD
jgi:hypothetical protein